jgi:hypothetical protein
LAASWEPTTENVLNQDILIQALPTERATLNPQADFRELGGRSCGEQGKLVGRKTDDSVVQKLEANSMPIDPAAAGRGGMLMVILHGN